MSTILTTIESRSDFIQLNSAAYEVKELVEKLLGILKKFHHYHDWLSERLFKKSLESIDFVTTNLSLVETESTLCEIAKKIDEIKEILVNDIDRAPLNDPVIYQDLIWERWHLEELRVHKGSYQSHEFAIEVLHWIQLLPHQYLLENDKRDITETIFITPYRSQITPDDIEIYKIRMESFIQLASQAKLRIHLEKQHIDLEEIQINDEKKQNEELSRLSDNLNHFQEELQRREEEKFKKINDAKVNFNKIFNNLQNELEQISKNLKDITIQQDKSNEICAAQSYQLSELFLKNEFQKRELEVAARNASSRKKVCIIS